MDLTAFYLRGASWLIEPAPIYQERWLGEDTGFAEEEDRKHHKETHEEQLHLPGIYE